MKILLTIMSIVLLAGCGHTGALYLPKEDPPKTQNTPSQQSIVQGAEDD